MCIKMYTTIISGIYVIHIMHTYFLSQNNLYVAKLF